MVSRIEGGAESGEEGGEGRLGHTAGSGEGEDGVVLRVSVSSG